MAAIEILETIFKTLEIVVGIAVPVDQEATTEEWEK